MNKKLAFYVFLICSALGPVALSQSVKNEALLKQFNEAGLPFIQNYTPDDYNAHGQNWGAVQDSLGILYFANGEGVLAFDGVNWEIIILPSQGHAKSIAIDHKNRIYVGASGEFGYLETDVRGAMKYVSISSQLEKDLQNFTTVWQIQAAQNGIYFQTNEYIFRWANNSFKVWKSDQGSKFSRIFLVNDILYFSELGKGLMFIDNDEIKAVTNGKYFANKRLTDIVPFGEGHLLIATIDTLFVHSKQELRPFITEVDNYIQENLLYGVQELNDGSLALGTINGGIVVIDKKGKKRLILNDLEILASLSVYNLFKDNSGMLWATLGFGIAKIELPSPFSSYDKLGVSSTTFAITRFDNEIYAGTGNGLFKLIDKGPNGPHFENVKGIKDHIWDLLVFKDILLIAWEEGVYELKENVLSPIGKWNPSAFFRSKLDSNRVFISLENGLGSIYYNDGVWVDEGILAGVQGSTYTILEEETGDLWLETSEDWVWRVSFENKESALRLDGLKLDKFGPDQGLPADTGNIYMLGGRVIYASDHGRETFEFDRNSNQFKPDSSVNTAMGMQGKNVFIEHIDVDENVYFSIKVDQENEKHFAAWQVEDEKYRVEDLKEERIAKRMGSSIYVELKDSVLWHGSTKGVLRYDLKFAETETEPFQVLLKKVVYHNDSLLIAGVYGTQTLELPYKNNSFRFEYASPSFIQEQLFNYQIQLTGFDENWSTWSSETKKDYTNLPEGDYSFKVRAKNIFGELSEEDSYSFTILPPWYRTWWAYVGYSLSAIVLLISFNRLRSQQLRNKNLALEAIISERTEEVRSKNELLGLQTEKLKEMDVLKTRLFANISHEFRTPLTLIKSPIEKLEESKKNKISTTDIKMIRRNANRLLGLVNQLLDLSKLDGGKMQLDLAEGDVYKCIRAATSAFGSHAASRNIDFHVKVPSTRMWASFDRDKLEKILFNLLSNAFKFTPNGSQIKIHVWHDENKLHLEIADMGYGIKKENLPHIFDRFYQVDDSYTKENTGTGIGLALTKELVDLMGGAISAESEIAKGSIFKLNFPLEEIQTGKVDDVDYPKHQDYDEQFETVEPYTDATHPRKGTVLVIED
ncbi:MAG: HAMP domain-containing sensor histidine kinase, partial [Flavobacteriaceae bacterium]